MNKIKPAIGILLLLAIAFYGYRHRAGSERSSGGKSESRIRIGTNRALGTVTPYIARDKGFFDQQAIQAQVIDFNDVTTLMESITSGQLDDLWKNRGEELREYAKLYER